MKNSLAIDILLISKIKNSNKSYFLKYFFCSIKIYYLLLSFFITFDPNNFDFIVANKTENTFQFQVSPEYAADDLVLEVYNTNGQTLLRRASDDINTYILDMSYAQTGVYFIKLSNKELNAVRKIIVK